MSAATPCKPLGVTAEALADLSGYGRHLIGAIAHLREAWLSADHENRAMLELVLRALADSVGPDGKPVFEAVAVAGLRGPTRAWLRAIVRGEDPRVDGGAGAQPN